MKIKFATTLIAVMASIITPLATANTPIKHTGMCDASAAVPVSSSLFVVANDEDNTLRVYERDKAGAAIHSQDISDFLKINPKHPETDIEGATLIGNRIYWITSHGANSKGKERPNRRRLFATDFEVNGNTVNLKPVGKPFLGLIEAIEDSEHFKDFHLGDAAKKAPESEGGLNIEGLASTPDGHLLIGFRNSVADKKELRALIIELENPQAVIEGTEKPKLAKPIFLDLGGLGIRSIEYAPEAKLYFIIAGSYNDDDANFQLYSWSGIDDVATLIKDVDFQGLNPEALIVYPEEKTRIQILSDDGREKINGKECKELDAKDQRFHSTWLKLKP